jgi:hypothetical protein
VLIRHGVDPTRKKKGSNDDWTHPHDLDAKIRLAFEAQHAVTIVREPDLPVDEQTVLPMALSRAGRPPRSTTVRRATM